MSDLLSNLPELLTHEQLSELTQLDEGTLYQMNSRGTGPERIKLGRQVRYPKAGVVAWLESRRIPA